MANNVGDFATSTVIYGKFTTVQSTGAPATLAGTPALSVYKNNSTTQSTTGVTLTADFDSVTGLNHFAIDTSADGTFYSAGAFFDIVITTGTVNSVSAVGYCVGHFTLNATAALKPTTAGRTLDVTATGAAGIDWGNLENPSTSNNLSATTTNLVNTATTVTNQLTAAAIATGVWQDATAGDFTVASSIGKALYTGNVVPGAAGGHFIAGTNAATSITTALTANITGNLSGSVGSVTGSVGSVTGAVGSVTGNVGGNVVGSVGSVTGNVSGSVASVVGNVGGNVTGSVGSVAAGGLTAASFASGAFDAVWTVAARTLTAGTNIQLPANGLANITAWTVAITGNITGNLSGSVGSVTGLNPALLDVAVSTRLAAASYTAPDNAGIAAIKVKTDSLTFSVANTLDSNITYVNSVQVTGDGQTGTEWGPA